MCKMKRIENKIHVKARRYFVTVAFTILITDSQNVSQRILNAIFFPLSFGSKSLFSCREFALEYFFSEIPELIFTNGLRNQRRKWLCINSDQIFDRRTLRRIEALFLTRLAEITHYLAKDFFYLKIAKLLHLSLNIKNQIYKG